MKIKIGNKEYTIQKGDFIGLKDDVYTFYSGNCRVLLIKNNHHFTYLNVPTYCMPKRLLKSLRTEEKGKNTYWYFD